MLISKEINNDKMKLLSKQMIIFRTLEDIKTIDFILFKKKTFF